MKEARNELRSRSPRLICSFHVFEHNQHDVELARSLAGELGMEFSVSKGWVAGPAWASDDGWQFFKDPTADRCEMLWKRAVVHVDGGVSPCDGSFYREDDFGSVSNMKFREVWNNQKFRKARNLFRSTRPPRGQPGPHLSRLSRDVDASGLREALGPGRYRSVVQAPLHLQ